MQSYTVTYSNKHRVVRAEDAVEAINKLVERYLNNFANFSVKNVDADTRGAKWAIGIVQYGTPAQINRGDFDTIRIKAEVVNG